MGTRRAERERRRSSWSAVLVGFLAVAIGLITSGYTYLHGTAAARLDLLIFLDDLAASYTTIGLLMAPFIQRHTPPAPAMKISFAASHPATVRRVGPFDVEWSGGAQAQLRVVWAGCQATRQPGSVVWATRPGEPFVAAAASDSIAAESHGNFQIRERVLASCVLQRVDDAAARRGMLVLSGGFDDEAADCATLRWSLSLGTPLEPSADSTGRAQQLGFELKLHGPSHVNRAQLSFEAPRAADGAASPIWGLGVQYRHFNLRGHCVPSFISEQGIGRGAPEQEPLGSIFNALSGGASGSDFTTYCGSASYVTGSGSGLVLHNTELVLFDLGSTGASCTPSIVHGAHFGSGGAGEGTVALTAHAVELSGRILAPACAEGEGAAAVEGGAEGEEGGFVAESVHLAVIESLSEYTGRMRALPEWADSGAIIGLQGGDARVMRIFQTLREARVAVSALWLQDWVGQRETLLGDRLWWNWILDEGDGGGGSGSDSGGDGAAGGTAAVASGHGRRFRRGRYAGWDAMRRSVSPVRLLTYINPMLSDPDVDAANTAPAGGRARWARSLFREALEGGMLVRRRSAASPSPGKGGEGEGGGGEGGGGEGDGVHLVEVAGFEAAVVDLTRQSTREWLRDEVIRRELIGRAGSSGWMADFGEAMPCDGVALYDGRDACGYHSQYSVEWAALNKEAIEAAGLQGEALFFSRSGYTRSPNFSPLFWLGDQMTTWDEYDGIVSAVQATLGGGMSGFALTHSDVGGYTGVHFKLFGSSLLRVTRGPELTMRWAELCAFSGAVLRTHEGLLPDDNHQVWSDAATLAHFRRMVDIFVAFAPYRRGLMREAEARGWPLVRHPVLHYPTDRVLLADTGRDRLRQFMLGADYMVVPVLAANASTVRGYFPRGEWVSLWDGDAEARGATGKTSEGGLLRSAGEWLDVPAPIGRPAVYARRGAGSLSLVRERMRTADLF